MNESQTAITQKFARSVREAVGILSVALRQRAALCGGRFPFLSDDQHWSSVSGSKSQETLAWGIVSIWLTGVATRSLRSNATFSQAEEWFLPQDYTKRLQDTLPPREIRQAEGALSVGMNPEFCVSTLC